MNNIKSAYSNVTRHTDFWVIFKIPLVTILWILKWRKQNMITDITQLLGPFWENVDEPNISQYGPNKLVQ